MGLGPRPETLQRMFLILMSSKLGILQTGTRRNGCSKSMPLTQGELKTVWDALNVSVICTMLPSRMTILEVYIVVKITVSVSSNKGGFRVLGGAST
ncbi:hypothetical protein LINPERPRIM_LOCUS8919 [Linum perenne]